MTSPFAVLNLDQNILNNIDSLGFQEMTPIQAQSLPLILKGHDLIAKAKTGSGKTVAFGLGILSKIDINNLSPQSLILTPTRELAEQVSQEIRRLARFTENIKILTICGGASQFHQKKSLEYGAHIVIGTPGRTGYL